MTRSEWASLATSGALLVLTMGLVVARGFAA